MTVNPIVWCSGIRVRHVAKPVSNVEGYIFSQEEIRPCPDSAGEYKSSGLCLCCQIKIVRAYHAYNIRGEPFRQRIRILNADTHAKLYVFFRLRNTI